MDKISILIPYNSNEEKRDASFHWVVHFYQKMMPNAEICIGESFSSLFSRSEAINNAAKNASGNIFVIADADVVCNPFILSQSSELLKKHSWIIPYSNVLDLTQHCTQIIVKKEPIWPIHTHLDAKLRMIGKAAPLGGMNIVRRESFETVGGFDERFKGWGGEDDAFACSMNTLCGTYTRLNLDLYHFWHERNSSIPHPNYSANLQLAYRYRKANGNRQQMKEILSER